MIERARELRVTLTEAERALWSRLRGRRFKGMKFRRQHPLGNYIVDFVCLERRIIIELDGSQHAKPEAIKNDRRRSEWLQSRGFEVLRFWNAEVFNNMDGVLERLARSLDSQSL